MLRNEICGDISFLKIRLIEKFIQKIYVSFYSFDGNFSKCTDHLSNGTAAVFVINNDLGNHRIIVGRDCVVIINCCIHADSVSTGKMQVSDLTRAWHEMSLRILGIDSA